MYVFASNTLWQHHKWLALPQTLDVVGEFSCSELKKPLSDPEKCSLEFSCPIQLVLARLLAYIGEVRAARIRSDANLEPDLVLPDSRVLLVEIALQGLVSFGETPRQGCRRNKTILHIQTELFSLDMFRVKRIVLRVVFVRYSPRNCSTADITRTNYFGMLRNAETFGHTRPNWRRWKRMGMLARIRRSEGSHQITCGKRPQRSCGTKLASTLVDRTLRFQAS